MTDSTSVSDWLSLELSTAAERAEFVEEALFESGAVSVTLLDAEDHPLHEPAPGELPLWPRITVQALFDGHVDPADLIGHLRQLGVVESSAEVRVSGVAERDWERAWMDQYQPMRFGRNLWICPSHVEPDPAWPLVVRLDPGLAFGSGTHPTTALCLEWIDGLDLAEQAVIDYGCGSGVLAIAAALKGAKRVLAVDYDPQALDATGDNAARNGVDGVVQAMSPEAFSERPAPERKARLVLANILAGPLIELAPMLADCVEPGGHLVLSGILPDQAEEVADAYSDLDPEYACRQREGWVRLVFRRNETAADG